MKEEKTFESIYLGFNFSGEKTIVKQIQKMRPENSLQQKSLGKNECDYSISCTLSPSFSNFASELKTKNPEDDLLQFYRILLKILEEIDNEVLKFLEDPDLPIEKSKNITLLLLGDDAKQTLDQIISKLYNIENLLELPDPQQTYCKKLKFTKDNFKILKENVKKIFNYAVEQRAIFLSQNEMREYKTKNQKPFIIDEILLPCKHIFKNIMQIRQDIQEKKSNICKNLVGLCQECKKDCSLQSVSQIIGKAFKSYYVIFKQIVKYLFSTFIEFTSLLSFMRM